MSSQTSRTAYIDLIKRYLLDKKDWVGLSLSRPLQMSFTPIEEKESIGKRRKLSREDEVRCSVINKHAASFARISSHAEMPSSGDGLHNGADWKFRIHVSSPRKMRRDQEYSESPIKSMSSDTMLSGPGDEGEEDILRERNEQRSHTQSSMEDKAVTNDFVHVPDMQIDSLRDLDHLEQGISANPPANGDHIWKSPIPVLHRFTLDDQVLAEQLANSQIEANSSGSHRSDHSTAMLSHGSFKHPHNSGNDAFLDSSPDIQSVDGYIRLSGFHKSYPTDSDTLPQAQKISRPLQPGQSRLSSEAHFETPRVTSRMPTRQGLIVEEKAPMTLFGQEVHLLSLKPSDKDEKFVTSELPFQSSIHGFHMDSVTKGHSTSGFRFPNLWTPHRAIPQPNWLDTTGQKDDLAISPTVSHGRPSPSISTSSRGNSRLRQHLFSSKRSLKIPEETERIHAPVFNTPFRR